MGERPDLMDPILHGISAAAPRRPPNSAAPRGAVVMIEARDLGLPPTIKVECGCGGLVVVSFREDWTADAVDVQAQHRDQLTRARVARLLLEQATDAAWVWRGTVSAMVTQLVGDTGCYTSGGRPVPTPWLPSPHHHVGGPDTTSAG